MAPASAPLTKADFEALSEFRHQLRRFLRFSEDAVQAHDVTSQQYLLLLHLRGFPGRDWASVGELAHRLQLVPHGALALVQRCEKRGLVERRRAEHDRRTVIVTLTEAGAVLLEELAALHREELKAAGSRLRIPFE